MQGLAVGPYKKSNEVLPRYAEHSLVTGAGQNVRRPCRGAVIPRLTSITSPTRGKSRHDIQRPLVDITSPYETEWGMDARVDVKFIGRQIELVSLRLWAYLTRNYLLNGQLINDSYVDRAHTWHESKLPAGIICSHLREGQVGWAFS